MKFSERYEYEKFSDMIIRERITVDIQNAICNCYDKLHDDCYKIAHDNLLYYNLNKYIWCNFFNKKEIDFSKFGLKISPLIPNYIEDINVFWYQKLNLIEFTIEYLKRNIDYNDIILNFSKELNNQFERLHFSYRIINGLVVEILSDNEIKTIEYAIESNQDNIKLHLTNALKLYSNKPIGDYRNSIKESISAIEALNRHFTGENTLNLKKMKDKGVIIPSVLVQSFERLYGYSNDSSTGIRHALMDNSSEYIPGADEALFMLISCSAFINYLNNKMKDKNQ